MKVLAPILALAAVLAAFAPRAFASDDIELIPVRLTQTSPTTVEAEPILTEVDTRPLADWDIKDVDPLPVHRESVVYPVFSIQLGVPQVVSGSFGLIIGRVVYDASAKTGRVLAAGMLIQLETGLGGIKGSIGGAAIRTLDLPRGTLSVPQLATLMGAAVKASVLHTWGYPLNIDPSSSFGISALHTGETYAGAELELAFVVKVSVGMLYGISEGVRGEKLFTLSLGWGF